MKILSPTTLVWLWAPGLRHKHLPFLKNQYGGLNVLWNCSTCLKQLFNISPIVPLVWIVYIALPSNADNLLKDVPFVNSIIYFIEN